MGHEKSWKITENDFCENNKTSNNLNEWSFSHNFENKFSIFGHGKRKNSPGKGHGKSWNFIRSKQYATL